MKEFLENRVVFLNFKKTDGETEKHIDISNVLVVLCCEFRKEKEKLWLRVQNVRHA